MPDQYSTERDVRVRDDTSLEICRFRADAVLIALQASYSWEVMEARVEFLCGLSDVFPCLDPMGVSN